MEHNEFRKYQLVLTQKPFSLYPEPRGMDAAMNRFTLKDYDATHATLQNVNSQAEYLLPLALVEFANPGVLRLLRAVSPYNGSFV